MTEPEVLLRADQRESPVRDPEAAQRALVRVQQLLEKQRRVEALVHREQTPADDKKVLVEQLVHRQHLGELRSILDRLHAADIAYILEALPLDERLLVWDGVKADRDGEILVEVGDSVRETLIDAMDREELVDAVETLDALLAAGESSSYDIAFIDADKTNYVAYYERSLDLLRPGGLALVDNTLWGGRVADPEVADEDTVALRHFNEHLHRDGRVDLSLLPVGDGLTLARKRQEK